jgi:hypothetical protein
MCRFCEKSLSAEHRSWQEVNGLIEMLKVHELAKGVKAVGSWTYSVSDKPVPSFLPFDTSLSSYSFPFCFFTLSSSSSLSSSGGCFEYILFGRCGIERSRAHENEDGQTSAAVK